MRILLTNDDGIDAAGLDTLHLVLHAFGTVTVVAPAVGMSGCSHRATEGTFRVSRIEERRFAVEGTPVDCVRVALQLFPDEFDIVFAGINNGSNLGADVYHSGTIAAVREGSLRGLPGIAFSHYRNRHLTENDWRRAGEWAAAAIPTLLGVPRPEPGFWNVNFPCPPEDSSAIPELATCPLEMAPLPASYLVEGDQFHYQGRYAHRGRSKGSDVDACFSGKTSITYIIPPEHSLDATAIAQRLGTSTSSTLA